MKLALTVYTDETMTDVKRVIEADELKIPYRVSMYLLACLDTLDMDNENELLKFVAGNTEKIDKIVKATFGVSEAELECVNGGELISMIKELYMWAMSKVNGLGGDEKNGVTAAE